MKMSILILQNNPCDHVNMGKVCLFGNGGREHAISSTLERYGHSVVTGSVVGSLDAADLVFPTQEDHLYNGIVDRLQADGIRVFGPTKAQSMIECSRIYAKKTMNKLSIPTAPYIYVKDLESLTPCNIVGKVVKYNGPAAGKGVYLVSEDNAVEVLSALKQYGEDGFIVEDTIYGPEVSVMAFCNGEQGFLMPQCQDYKRIYDGDLGPNTGGMGAVCPANVLDSEQMTRVQIWINMIVKELKYKGILFAGLMLTQRGVMFLECNARFGDPETQVLMELLDTDLWTIMDMCEKGQVPDIKWKQNVCAAGVVLAHELYPLSKLSVPVPVRIDGVASDLRFYHSNIREADSEDGVIGSTTGGRVLTVVSQRNTVTEALRHIYNNLSGISYPGIYYRRDIGNNIIPDRINSALSIGIMASGNGTSVLELLDKQPELVKIIITDNHSATIVQRAYHYGIPCLYAGSRRGNDKYQEIAKTLRGYCVDMVILSGYMKIIPPCIFEEFHTINIHPSLLPKHGGLMDLKVHESVLQDSDRMTGCTLHMVTENVDAGDILMQRQCQVALDDDVFSLKRKVQLLEQNCIYSYLCSLGASPSPNAGAGVLEYSVDIAQADEFVKDLSKDNPYIGDFCVFADFGGCRDLALAADGCGTKIDLSVECGCLDTIGIDLVAMNVNDLYAGGAKPLYFMDYIALGKMNKETCHQIIKGIREGCRLSNCKLVGGETAEMEGSKLDIAGFAVGQRFETFDKHLISTGCKIYGIPSSGIHSNGYTLVRKLIGVGVEGELRPPIKDLLEPTRIYSEIPELCKTFRVHGIAHITGGGFPGNISRILPDTMTYRLKDWEFPPVFKWIQQRSGMSKESMLSTFNCGYGMVIISPDSLPYDHIGDIAVAL
jgi:phosphoribosylamine--glycine ligase/phosphoribosylaminoimidazole synthetase